MDLGGQDTSTDGDLQKTAMNSMKRILVEKQVLYVHVCVLYSVCMYVCWYNECVCPVRCMYVCTCVGTMNVCILYSVCTVLP